MSPKNVCLLFLLLSVLIGFPVICSVEASATVWSRTYGGRAKDSGEDIIQTGGGGYVVAGWTDFFGATTDPCKGWLVKIDASGDMVWNQTYGEEGQYIVHSLVEASDGGFALAGYISSSGAGIGDFWLAKTDSYGNLEWNRTYGGSNKESARDIIQTGDGGFVLAGYIWNFSAGTFDFWLVRTDSSGRMLWNQTYDEGSASLVKTSDGGIVFAGSNNSDVWLVNIDSDGGMLWNKTCGELGVDSVRSLVQTSDGGFVMVGGRRWLIKTDSSGRMLWNQRYGGGFNSLVEVSDGGYALVGSRNSDGWLVKVDSSGNMLWNRTYGGEERDRINSLVEAVDDGFVLAGRTKSFGVGGHDDLWLIKTDEKGIIPEFPSSTFLLVVFTAMGIVVVTVALIIYKGNVDIQKVEEEK